MLVGYKRKKNLLMSKRPLDVSIFYTISFTISDVNIKESEDINLLAYGGCMYAFEVIYGDTWSRLNMHVRIIIFIVMDEQMKSMKPPFLFENIHVQMYLSLFIYSSP